MINPYDVLEIEPTATKEEIQDAYKRLVKIYHPDIIETGNAEKFKEIQKAYEILSDEKEKHTFDTFGVDIKNDPIINEAYLKCKDLCSQILQKIIEGRYAESSDIIELMRQEVTRVRKEEAVYLLQKRSYLEGIKKYSEKFQLKLKKRRKRHKYPDFFKVVIEEMYENNNEYKEIEAIIRNMEHSARVLDTMMDILQDFS